MGELRLQLKIKDIEIANLKEENRLLVKQYRQKKDAKRRQFTEVL